MFAKIGLFLKGMLVTLAVMVGLGATQEALADGGTTDLPAGVATYFTNSQSDITTMQADAWPLILGIAAAMFGVFIFKKFAGKSGGR